MKGCATKPVLDAGHYVTFDSKGKLNFSRESARSSKSSRKSAPAFHWHRKIRISRQIQPLRLAKRHNRLMLWLARFRTIILAWAGASVFFTAVLELSEFGHKPLGFALYSNAVHFAFWGLALPLVVKCIRLFPLKRPKRIRNGAICLAFVALLALAVSTAHWGFAFLTWFPYRSSDSTFSAVLRGEVIGLLPNEILIGIVLMTALQAWDVLKDLQAERVRSMDLERQLAVSRLEALRMQLHPHFLFNTLHAVAGLTVEDPPTARRMVIALGDLLRNTLKPGGGQMRTLAEELDYSDLYLGIEKLRLGDRLALNYEIEPSAARALVPQFLLQPLFENAIRHGVSHMTGPCEVRFSAVRKLDTLEITICNEGPKRDVSQGPPRFGVGLTNTVDRLRIQYGDRHTFKYVDRPEGGAQIDISIPYAASGDAGDANRSNGEAQAFVRVKGQDLSDQVDVAPVSALERS
jgi:two-component system, LytTR family, sensor kinase